MSSPASTNGDPHNLGFHGDRYDTKGLNNTVYCTFSSRDLIANVRFMYDTFLMGGMCYNCMTKVVHGSFMKVSTMPVLLCALHPSNRNRPAIQRVSTFADTAPPPSAALHHNFVTTFVSTNHPEPSPHTLTHITTLSYICASGDLPRGQHGCKRHS